MSRITFLLCSFCLFVIASYSARSQGSFVNLDFEAANVQDLPFPSSGEFVEISNGVPGWNVSPTAGGGTLMLHNSLPLAGAGVSINGPQWPSNQILQGRYTVTLFHSIAGVPPQIAVIFQTGQIPPTANSIQFYGAGTLAVSFAGQDIPLFPIGSGTNYTIYGGNISAFAGQTGQLLFTGNAFLDNISFSPSTIPEPNVICLSALGVFLLGFRFRRRINTK